MLRREAALETGDRAHAGWGGAPPAEAPAELPPGFDEAAFLEGARRAYRMLQDAWDKGDLADLRALTTEDVFAELEGQLAARQGKSRTEVLHLDARLLEARDAGLEMEASVLFDAFLREEDAEQGADDRGHQVREVWHFVRPAGRRQPTWFLDGIQQLE
jgi:predicted lipid-binding transport protein (Tim44 family)